MSEIIPVLHCFNDAYVIPAAVSFYSMLEHADASREYRLYVLHSDISEEHRKKLQETISPFKNATLEFIDMKDRFEDLYNRLPEANNYSKEMFYRFLAPSLFPQYDKMMITDVDVVWMDDIAPDFDSFDEKEDYYLAGVSLPYPLETPIEHWRRDFVSVLRKLGIKDPSLLTCAGYWIFNLKKMRNDNIETKIVRVATENAEKLLYLDEFAVTFACEPKIKLLPIRSTLPMTMYEGFKNSPSLASVPAYPKDEILLMMHHPVQLHYISKKPWNDPCCEKSQHWFSCLAKTPFFQEQMDKFMTKPKSKKTKVSFKLFSLLPVVSVVQKAGSRKCRFFGVPVLKIRDDGVFLFCFLKIGKISQ